MVRFRHWVEVDLDGRAHFADLDNICPLVEIRCN